MRQFLATFALLFAPILVQARPTVYSQFDTTISPGGTETSRGAAFVAAIVAVLICPVEKSKT